MPQKTFKKHYKQASMVACAHNLSTLESKVGSQNSLGYTVRLPQKTPFKKKGKETLQNGREHLQSYITKNLYLKYVKNSSTKKKHRAKNQYGQRKKTLP